MFLSEEGHDFGKLNRCCWFLRRATATIGRTASCAQSRQICVHDHATTQARQVQVLCKDVFSTPQISTSRRGRRMLSARRLLGPALHVAKLGYFTFCAFPRSQSRT